MFSGHIVDRIKTTEFKKANILYHTGMNHNSNYLNSKYIVIHG